MCATFQLGYDDDPEIQAIADELTKKYGPDTVNRIFGKDFYPGSEAPVIGKRSQVVLLKWGFPMSGKKQVLFNARAESLTQKRMYQGILSNRCLVPATSFYEWDKEKTKYRISVEGGKLFYMAALWKLEILKDRSKVYYYTIITTEPNQQVGEIHNRMPAVIAPAEASTWLHSNPESFKLLRPYERSMTIAAV